MKKIVSIFFLVMVFSLQAQEKTQKRKELEKGTKELQNQVKSLLDYYQKYEKNTSKKDKKNALDKAIDDLAGKGNVSEKDKSDAFKVIDAYITADKTPTKHKPEKKQITIKDSPEVKRQAQDYFNAAKNSLLAMPYSEYEKNIWVENPMASRREIKESYNKLHENDGKSVSISANDNDLTDTQKQVNAYFTLENAKTYEEFKKAIKVLNPKASDEDIKKAWNNR